MYTLHDTYSIVVGYVLELKLILVYKFIYGVGNITIMNVFETGLCVLSLMCVLIYKQSTHPECRDPQFSKFKRTYLFVYLIATGRL